MLSELHPITDIERRRRQRTKFVIPATGGLLNSTVSSLIKLLFQPRRCAAQTCNDLLPNQYIRAVARPTSLVRDCLPRLGHCWSCPRA